MRPLLLVVLRKRRDACRRSDNVAFSAVDVPSVLHLQKKLMLSHMIFIGYMLFTAWFFHLVHSDSR